VQGPLLQASLEWVHKLFRDAVASVPEENGDVHGLSVSRATLLQSLDRPPTRSSSDRPYAATDADAALDLALNGAKKAPGAEPLAVAARALGLDPLEFRMLVLAWSPELDLRFQRCIGFLLDEMARRVGTTALYSALLGVQTRVRSALAKGGRLSRWFVFEDCAGRAPAADEPLRLDPFLARWLLGGRSALAHDPRVRRVLRVTEWPGSALLDRPRERADALDLVGKLRDTSVPGWILLGGDPAAWRALLELGAQSLGMAPIRVEPSRLGGLDASQVEECARLVGRMARLSGEPLVVDLAQSEGAEGEDASTRTFLSALDRTECRAAAIDTEGARLVRLLGSARHQLVHDVPLSKAARVEAVREAAIRAGARPTQESAEAISDRYPLQLDGFEYALQLAQSRPVPYGGDDPELTRFTAACKEIAAEGLSRLADRIEPIFSLDEVVLPLDRKQQLAEIVDHVRFAPRVLDEWGFREQLPFGRGVTALFFGPSGTGKTMAAMGIAHRLGIQMLRLDLSRVVSKYIGDTEKNIDRAFTDAQRSGCVIVVDEAEGLLGKRSEVKDAHDRYANIEVAYLLQRMEAYEGLAILTTNLKQNLDPAFLRRLRFIIEFPRPDVEARERIWRQCLPDSAHVLDDAAFRQLARRIDLTGGNIRQITLRAAFIAAAASARVTLEHVAQAARAELAKLGMPPVELILDRSRRAA
jgi:AAA+ superfamily predicted ATPase